MLMSFRHNKCIEVEQRVADGVNRPGRARRKHTDTGHEAKIKRDEVRMRLRSSPPIGKKAMVTKIFLALEGLTGEKIQDHQVLLIDYYRVSGENN